MFEEFLADYLGAKIQPGSGSGVIDREDLVLDDTYLIQLKATAAKSAQVKLDDLKKLIMNANRVDLLPAFIIGFEEHDTFTPSKVFVAVPLSDWI